MTVKTRRLDEYADAVMQHGSMACTRPPWYKYAHGQKTQFCTVQYLKHDSDQGSTFYSTEFGIVTLVQPPLPLNKGDIL